MRGDRQFGDLIGCHEGGGVCCGLNLTGADSGNDHTLDA